MGDTEQIYKSDSSTPEGKIQKTNVGIESLPLLASLVGVFVFLFICSAMLGYGWATGVYVDKNGGAHDVMISLYHVYFAENDKYYQLNKLCLGDPEYAHIVNINHKDHNWCWVETAGTATDILLWMTMIPTVAATLFAIMLFLKVKIPAVQQQFSRLKDIGITESVQNMLLIFVWVFDWIMLFSSLLVYAGCLPDTIGMGPLTFEASFGYIRLSFVLVSISTALLAADLLELWDETEVKNALAEFEKKDGPVKITYFLVMLQLFLYVLISLERMEWQCLVCLFAIFYLEMGRKNFALMFLGTTLTTMIFDSIFLSKMPLFDNMSGGHQFTEFLFICTFCLKPILMVLIVVVWKSGLVENKNADKDDYALDDDVDDNGVDMPIAV